MIYLASAHRHVTSPVDTSTASTPVPLPSSTVHAASFYTSQYCLVDGHYIHRSTAPRPCGTSRERSFSLCAGHSLPRCRLGSLDAGSRCQCLGSHEQVFVAGRIFALGATCFEETQSSIVLADRTVVGSWREAKLHASTLTGLHKNVGRTATVV